MTLPKKAQPKNVTRSPARPSPDGEQKRRLLLATITASLVAIVVLIVAVLPAEYGIDPTGIGKLAGFTKLSEPAAANQTTPNATTLYKYRLTWPVQPSPIESRTGYTAEGETSNVLLTLDIENVTRVIATLSWHDDNETGGQRTKPDLFELQVVGPDGNEGPQYLGRNGPDGAGNVTASMVWRLPPSSQTVRAETDDDAADQAADLVTRDLTGRGEWTIRVALLDAGDTDAQGVPIPGPAGDQGNRWELGVTVEAYRFDAAGLNASREREDRVRIEIPAGTGLEYKFDLEEGAPMEYEWNTTGPNLHFDFHGERRGDVSGAFTSHKSGSKSRDAGLFTAPFAGSHGWYWENQGDGTVTVELVTTGVYSVIGRK